MTRPPSLPELALLTLRDPAAAAEVILARPIPKEAIWTAIALVSVVITLLSSLSNMIFPVPDPLSGIVGTPFVYFLIVAGGFIATVYALYWTGLLLGGRGRIEDLMVLLLWLQMLRAAAQAAVFVLLLLAPAVASILVLVVAAATLWVFVHFIRVALNLGSLLRAFVVLVFGAVVLVAALSYLLSLFGLTAMGVPLNV